MIQSIRRAAAVLRSIDGHPAGRSLAEIASDVDLPRSTVHRIVLTLQAEHLVVAASTDGGYRLGPGLMRLASSANRLFVDHVHDKLVALSLEVGETVDLSIRSGRVVLFIDQIPAVHRLQAVSAIGLSFPLHCTAPGKAILADLPSADIDALISSPLERHTQHTIIAPGDLRSQLDEIRDRRVAFDREEHHVGICAIGTTLENPTGLHAAISIPVPASRFAGREDELVEALLEARRAIEHDLAN